jgi:hypothetical protein
MGGNSVLADLQDTSHEREQHMLQKREIRHLGCASFDVMFTLTCLEDPT